jgi:diketogulonate reductase-like aldo/keto reductase
MEDILSQSYKLSSGYAMPVLGLGTWRLAGTACERIVSKALELGYRHIDTAELYGNEAEIGRAIRNVERGGLFITSKVSLRWLLQKGAIVIPKAGSIEHLRENMEMDGWELTPEEMRRIDEIGIEMKVVDATYT